MGKVSGDLSGQRFGCLTVIDLSHRTNQRHSVWRCVCDCGNERLVIRSMLTGGEAISCGCYKRPRPDREPKPIAGQRFGRLVAIALVGRRKSGYYLWLCACDCGEECRRDEHQLAAMQSRSCGCHKRKHGAAVRGIKRSQIYRTWCNMKRRCASSSDRSYPRYGGRGIRVCERWLRDFATFKADMGPRPAGMSLERIDVDGDYEPSNCCWADAKAQALNRRSSLWYRERQNIQLKGETSATQDTP